MTTEQMMRRWLRQAQRWTALMGIESKEQDMWPFKNKKNVEQQQQELDIVEVDLASAEADAPRKEPQVAALTQQMAVDLEKYLPLHAREFMASLLAWQGWARQRIDDLQRENAASASVGLAKLNDAEKRFKAREDELLQMTVRQGVELSDLRTKRDNLLVGLNKLAEREAELLRTIAERDVWINRLQDEMAKLNQFSNDQAVKLQALEKASVGVLHKDNEHWKAKCFQLETDAVTSGDRLTRQCQTIEERDKQLRELQESLLARDQRLAGMQRGLKEMEDKLHAARQDLVKIEELKQARDAGRSDGSIDDRLKNLQELLIERDKKLTYQADVVKSLTTTLIERNQSIDRQRCTIEERDVQIKQLRDEWKANFDAEQKKYVDLSQQHEVRGSRLTELTARVATKAEELEHVRHHLGDMKMENDKLKAECPSDLRYAYAQLIKERDMLRSRRDTELEATKHNFQMEREARLNSEANFNTLKEERDELKSANELMFQDVRRASDRADRAEALCDIVTKERDNAKQVNASLNTENIKLGQLRVKDAETLLKLLTKGRDNYNSSKLTDDRGKRISELEEQLRDSNLEWQRRLNEGTKQLKEQLGALKLENDRLGNELEQERDDKDDNAEAAEQLEELNKQLHNFNAETVKLEQLRIKDAKTLNDLTLERDVFKAEAARLGKLTLKDEEIIQDQNKELSQLKEMIKAKDILLGQRQENTVETLNVGDSVRLLNSCSTPGACWQGVVENILIDRSGVSYGVMWWVGGNRMYATFHHTDVERTKSVKGYETESSHGAPLPLPKTIEKIVAEQQDQQHKGIADAFVAAAQWNAEVAKLHEPSALEVQQQDAQSSSRCCNCGKMFCPWEKPSRCNGWLKCSACCISEQPKTEIDLTKCASCRGNFDNGETRYGSTTGNRCIECHEDYIDKGGV